MKVRHPGLGVSPPVLPAQPARARAPVLGASGRGGPRLRSPPGWGALAFPAAGEAWVGAASGSSLGLGEVGVSEGAVEWPPPVRVSFVAQMQLRFWRGSQLTNTVAGQPAVVGQPPEEPGLQKKKRDPPEASGGPGGPWGCGGPDHGRGREEGSVSRTRGSRGGIVRGGRRTGLRWGRDVVPLPTTDVRA